MPLSAERKEWYFGRLKELLDAYTKILVVQCDNVSSKQMSQVRRFGGLWGGGGKRKRVGEIPINLGMSWGKMVKRWELKWSLIYIYIHTCRHP